MANRLNISLAALLASAVGIVSCEVAPIQDQSQPRSQPEPAPEPTQKVTVTPEVQQKPAPKKTIDRRAVFLGSDGRMAGLGNPNSLVSEAFRLGRGDHPQALSVPGLPKDKFGLIDWIAMVDQQVIKPVGSLQPGAPEVPVLELDVLIKAKGDFVNDVLFRHKPHTYWLTCEICHNGIFIMAKGQNNMSMVGISQGKWCGRCHGKVSFPLTDCTRCHSQPKQNT